MQNLFFMSLLFILVSLFPAQLIQAEPHPPLIGAQISVLTPNTAKGCETYFRNLKKLGYNTIILRVFHNRGDRFHGLVGATTRKLKTEGVYFKTNKVPVIADILPLACKCAHKSGLKIFAWMNTLKADYSHQLKQKVLTYNQKTGQIEPEKTLLEPTAAENTNFLVELFTDLAAHPIDGILLQDDLMLRHNQGFAIINHRVEPAPNELYNFDPNHPYRIKSYKPKFKSWRQQQAVALQSLADQIFAASRRSKPELLCAQNLHYEVLYKTSWGRDWFAWTKTALENSSANYLMVMAYQERIRKELELNSGDKLAEAMNRIFTNARQWQPQRSKIVFKFESPLTTSSRKQKQKSITTLRQTITQARRNHWHDLVITPCNTLTAAESIKE